MLLLVIFTVLFFIVISMIIYANWPSYSSGRSCGGADCGQCDTCVKPARPPCGRCGMGRGYCRSPKKPGCDFC